MKQELKVVFILSTLILSGIIIVHNVEDVEVTKEYESTVEYIRNTIDRQLLTDRHLEQLAVQGFIKNIGQVSDRSIQYYISAVGIHVGFSTSKITFINSTGGYFELNFPNSNTVNPQGKYMRSNKQNYYTNGLALTNVPSYNEVVYTNLYNGIDLVYYLTHEGLKYDFIVHPGADPSQIRVSTNSILSVLRNEVTIQSKGIKISDSNLLVTQNDFPVEAYFKPLSSREYGFTIPYYDSSKLLVIDPLLLNFSQYIGGIADDQGMGIDTDGYDNVYITGSTISSDFPTYNAYNDTYGGNSVSDVFVAKFNSTGGMLFSSYFGGSAADNALMIKVDSFGNAVIVGNTESSNFPTTSGLYTTYNGSVDAFAARFTSGGGLTWSTFLGGTGADYLKDIVLSSAYAHLAGYTTSTDYVISSGAYQTSNAGGEDGIYTRLSLSTGVMIYSTYFGGSGNDQAEAIDLDPSGNIFLAGTTYSTNLPTTSGTVQPAYGKRGDSFIFKFTSSMTVVWGSYFGLNSVETLNDMAIDEYGQAFLVGSTTSGSFPDINAFQDKFGGGSTDGYINKFSADGSTLIFSTYYGGTGSDEINSIAIDDIGNAYITGYAGSSLPTTSTAYQIDNAGGMDAFVAKFTTDGYLENSSYMGGSGDDYGMGIVISVDFDIYMVGHTTSTDFPVFDSTANGGADGFVSKYYNPKPPEIKLNIANNSKLYPGEDIKLDLFIDDGDIDAAWYNWDGGTNYTIEYPWTIPAPTTPGNHTLNIYANDTYQQIVFMVYIFTIEGPSIVLNNPANYSRVLPTAQANITVTDYTYSISSAKYAWDSGSNTTFTPSSYDFIDIPDTEGSRTLHVYATNSNGDSTYRKFVFIVDNTSPSISITSPSNGSFTTDTWVQLNYSITEADPSYTTTVYFDGTANSTAWQSGYNITSLSNGVHNITITVVDSVGNIGRTEISFTVSSGDTDDPVINIISPSVQTYGSNSVVVSYSVSDASSYTTTIFQDSVANSSNFASGSTWSSLSDSTHNLTIKVVDSVGNTAISTIIFDVDTSDPVINITSPSAQTYGSNSVVVSYSVSDAHSYSTTIYQDSVANSSNFASGSTWSSLSDTTHNLTIKVVDSVGNTAISTILFDVDTSDPVINITSPSAQTYSSNSVTVSYSVSDVHSYVTTIYQDSVANSSNFASGSTWSSLSDSTHNLTIKVVDSVGNTAISTVIFDVDTSDPLINITSPSAQTYGSNSVVVTYSISDAHSYSTTIYQDSVANSSNFASDSSWNSLSDSTHNLTLKVVDSVGNTAISTIIFDVDTSDPVINITSPSAQTYGSNSVVVSYSISDAHSYSTTIYQDSVANSSNFVSGSSWSSLSDSTHNLTIKVVDSVGNTAISTVIFDVDTSDPIINITNPSAQTYGSNSVVVTYSVSDAHSYVTTIFQDSVANSSNFASGSTWLSLSDATHNLTIKVVDDVGNTAISTILFDIDTSDPLINITSPSAQTYGSNSVVVTYSISDAHSYVTTIYQDSVANSSNFASGSSWSSLSDATHNLTIKVVDEVGNSAISTIIFNVDTSDPVINITSPSAQTYGSNSVVVSYSISDAHSYSTTIYQDSVSNSSNFASGSSWSSLSETTHNLTIKVVDSVGNTAISTILFDVDTSDPVINIISPSAQTYGSSSVTVSYSVSDAHSYVTTIYQDSVANSSNFASGSSWSSLSDSTHNLTIKVVDSVGNTAISTILFDVDTSVPVINITSPSAQTYGSNSITVSYSISDAHSYSTTIFQDSVANSSNFASGSSWSSLSDSTHNLTIKVVDSVGNSAISTVIFDVDTSDPIINITSPSAQTYGSNSVVVSYSVSDAHSYVTTIYQDSVANSSNFASGSTWSSLSDSTHNLTIKVVDSVGNTAISTVIFTINASAPEITITSPSAQVYGSNAVTISYTVSEGDVTVFLDGVSNSSNIQSGYSWSGLSDSQHNLTILASNLGNDAVSTVLFEIDTSDPVVSITSPSAQTYGSNSVVVTYSISDAHSYRTTIYLDSVANSSNLASGSSWSSLSDSTHNLTIVVTDDLGNKATETVIFIVDTTSPTISISSPSGSYDTTDLSFTYSVTEASDYVTKIFINGVENTTNIASGSTLSLGQGETNITIQVIDALGQVSTDTSIVYVDSIAPVVDITSPTSGNYDTTDLSFTYSISENSDYQTNIFINGVENSTNLASGSTLSLGQGETNITIQVIDALGHVTTDTSIVYIDSVAPVVDITSPSSGNYDTTDLTFNYTIDETSDYTTKIFINGVENNTAIASGSTLSLDQGETNITIQVIDELGNVSTDTSIVYVDSVAPVVDITAPLSGNYDTTDLTFTYTIDEDSDYTTKIFINGVENNTAIASGSTLSLGQGETNITIQVIDELGNVSTDTSIIYVDSVVPVVDITSPTSGNYDTTDLTFTYTIDEDSDYTTKIFINGVENNTNIASGSTLTLSQGETNITIQVIDELGNISTDTSIVFVDSVAPVVDITSPTSGNYDTTDLSFTYSITESSDYQTKIFINGVENTTNIVSGSILNLGQGETNITIKVIDELGNVSTDTSIVYIDSIAPVIDITSPKSGNYDATDLSFTYSITENSDYVTKILINSVDNTTNIASGSTITLDQGESNITIQVTDDLGNVSVQTVIVYVDSIAPTVSITSPSGLYNSPDQILSYTISDQSTFTTEIIINGVTNTTNIASGSTVTLSEGENTVQIRVVDEAGNIATSDVQIIIDTIGPIITISEPDATYYRTDSVNINYAITELTSTEVWLDGVKNTSAIESGYLWNSLSEGNHNLTIYAEDQAGNIDVESVVFIIDLTAPTVNIISPTTKAYANGSIALEYTSTGNYLEIYINGVKNTTNLQSGSILDLDEASYNLTIMVMDLAGNQATSDVQFLVDYTSPVLTILTPDAGIGNDDNISISYSFSDSVNTDVFLDGVLNSSITNSGFLWVVSEGIHNVTIRIEDAAGNSAVDTVIFEVDLTIPPLSIFTLTGMTIYQAELELNYSVAESVLTTIYIDNVANTTSIQPLQVISLTEGVHNISIVAKDEAGNINKQQINITVDYSSPVISLLSPENNAVIEMGAEINLSVNDPHVSIDKVWYRWGTHEIVYLSSLSLNAEYYGIIPLTVYANNSNGVITEVTYFFDVLGSGPDTFLSEFVGNPVNGSIIYIDVPFSIDNRDNYDALDTFWYSWDDGENFSLDAELSMLIYPLEQIGTHVLTIHVNNTRGQIASETYIFIIYGTGPQLVQLTAKSTGEKLNFDKKVKVNENEQLELFIHDDYSPLTEVNYTWSNGDSFQHIEINENDFEVTIDLISPGRHSLTVYAANDLGQSINQVLELLIFGVGPSIDVKEGDTNAVNGSSTTKDSQFQVTIYDPDLNITQVQYNWDSSMNFTIYSQNGISLDADQIDVTIPMNNTVGYRTLNVYTTNEFNQTTVESYFFLVLGIGPIIRAISDNLNGSSVAGMSDLFFDIYDSDNVTLLHVWYDMGSQTNLSLEYISETTFKIITPFSAGEYTMRIGATNAFNQTTISEFVIRIALVIPPPTAGEIVGQIMVWILITFLIFLLFFMLYKFIMFLWRRRGEEEEEEEEESQLYTQTSGALGAVPHPNQGGGSDSTSVRSTGYGDTDGHAMGGFAATGSSDNVAIGIAGYTRLNKGLIVNISEQNFIKQSPSGEIIEVGESQGSMIVRNTGDKNYIHGVKLKVFNSHLVAPIAEFPALEPVTDVGVVKPHYQNSWVTHYSYKDRALAPIKIKETYIDMRTGQTPVFNGENMQVRCTIKIHNNSLEPITNIMGLKKILDGKVVNKKIDNGEFTPDIGDVIFAIEKIEPDQTTEVIIDLYIQGGKEYNYQTGKLEIMYNIDDILASDLNIQYAKGVSDHKLKFRKLRRKGEPKWFDCEFSYRNVSEFSFYLNGYRLTREEDPEFLIEERFEDVEEEHREYFSEMNIGHPFEYFSENYDYPMFKAELDFEVYNEIHRTTQAIISVDSYGLNPNGRELSIIPQEETHHVPRAVPLPRAPKEGNGSQLAGEIIREFEDVYPRGLILNISEQNTIKMSCDGEVTEVGESTGSIIVRNTGDKNRIHGIKLSLKNTENVEILEDEAQFSDNTYIPVVLPGPENAWFSYYHYKDRALTPISVKQKIIDPNTGGIPLLLEQMTVQCIITIRNNTLEPVVNVMGMKKFSPFEKLLNIHMSKGEIAPTDNTLVFAMEQLDPNEEVQVVMDLQVSPSDNFHTGELEVMYNLLHILASDLKVLNVKGVSDNKLKVRKRRQTGSDTKYDCRLEYRNMSEFSFYLNSLKVTNDNPNCDYELEKKFDEGYSLEDREYTRDIDLGYAFEYESPDPTYPQFIAKLDFEVYNEINLTTQTVIMIPASSLLGDQMDIEYKDEALPAISVPRPAHINNDERLINEAEKAMADLEALTLIGQAEEEARLQAEEEARLQAEEEARLQAEEEARLQAEEEARLQAEEEARLQAEEEARLQAEEEARLQAEEEARLQAEEEARLQAEEESKVDDLQDAINAVENIELETTDDEGPNIPQGVIEISSLKLSNHIAILGDLMHPIEIVLSSEFLSINKLNRLDVPLVFHGLSSVNDLKEFSNGLKSLASHGVRQLIIRDNAVNQPFMTKFNESDAIVILELCKKFNVQSNVKAIVEIADVYEFMQNFDEQLEFMNHIVERIHEHPEEIKQRLSTAISKAIELQLLSSEKIMEYIKDILPLTKKLTPAEITDTVRRAVISGLIELPDDVEFDDDLYDLNKVITSWEE
ncbi:MAG: SBBP repeat-containing protein [Candidatus Heimdallarchaeota archaeon]|nr:SBBP repeat-containing protein [Candidatus Heimdallarchaeota archaeon]